MICYSGIIGMAYAISDEIHQHFVIKRSARIEDVIIDIIGVLTGIFVYLLYKELVEMQRKKIFNRGN